MDNTFSLETAQTILSEIEGSMLSSLKHQLYSSALRYAHVRAEWKLMSLEERKDSDQSRTLAHNVFIDACNILSRNMIEKGESAAWRSKLGEDRKIIGDFACYLHCLFAVESR